MVTQIPLLTSCETVGQSLPRDLIFITSNVGRRLRSLPPRDYIRIKERS